MNRFFGNKDDQIKVTLKAMAIMVIGTVGLYVLKNKVITPLLQSTPDVVLMPLILIGLMITVYMFNAALNSSSINEMRMILEMERLPIILTVIPVFADIGMREYYEEFIYLEGEDNISPVPMLLTLVSSLAFVASIVFFIFVVIIEDISYLTPKLLTAYMLLLASFTALSTCRSLVISEIIVGVNYRTYMNKPNTYKIISRTVAVAWIFFFIITPILQFIGISISYPLLNIIVLFIPMFILPVITFHGIKQVRRDIVKDWWDY